MSKSEMDRRAFMRYVAAMAAAGGTGACAASDVVSGPFGVLQAQNANEERRRGRHTPLNRSLRDFAKARNLPFGLGTHAAVLTDVPLMDAHAAENGMITPANQGQWTDTHPTQFTWDFDEMDALWAFAQSLNLPMRGTHLIHHAALPSWVFTDVNASNAAQTIQDHINMFVGRFPGLHSWNAVNEVVYANDGRPDGLRNSIWMQLLGPQYINMAFDFAHQADPSTQLVLNEFNLEDDTPSSDTKRTHTLNLLTNLLNAGVPVHALGMQSHLAWDTLLNSTKITSFLNSVAALGLKIFITELDVNDQTAPANIVTRDRLVADKYHEYLALMLPHPAVNTLIIWGLSDRLTWLIVQKPRADGLPVRVMPFDDQMMRKEAWLSIANALRGY